MVREIITVNIGQGGVQLGQSVWEQYCKEHKINKMGKKKTKFNDDAFKSMFQENNDGKYVPRNLMVDLEPNVIDDVKISPYANIFDNHFLLNGKEDAANLFARGHYTVGKEMIDKCNDRIRKLYDACDDPQGFIINHAVGGGTGSGLGALILERLSVDYRKKCKFGFEIYPSPTYSTCVVEPYNALLSTHWLLDHTEVSVVLDNEALYEICQKWLNIPTPSYNNINKLITKPISSITADLRFDGQLNVDLNEFQTNLVPFPRLHFIITSIAPLTTSTFDLQSMTASCFQGSNFFVKMADFDAEEDKYMAISVKFKGNVKAKEANATVQWLKTNKKVTFVEWCPTGFKVGLNDDGDDSDDCIGLAVGGARDVNNFRKAFEKKTVKKKNKKTEHFDLGPTSQNNDIAAMGKSVCMMGNNTCISRFFSERISKKYDLMYCQRAYVHWYVREGMEEGEFAEAREDLGFLEKDYLDVLCEQATDDDDYDDSDDDDDDDNYGGNNGIPALNSITYNGILYEYYFDTRTRKSLNVPVKVQPSVKKKNNDDDDIKNSDDNKNDNEGNDNMNNKKNDNDNISNTANDNDVDAKDNKNDINSNNDAPVKLQPSVKKKIANDNDNINNTNNDNDVNSNLNSNKNDNDNGDDKIDNNNINKDDDGSKNGNDNIDNNNNDNTNITKNDNNLNNDVNDDDDKNDSNNKKNDNGNIKTANANDNLNNNNNGNLNSNNDNISNDKNDNNNLNNDEGKNDNNDINNSIKKKNNGDDNKNGNDKMDNNKNDNDNINNTANDNDNLNNDADDNNNNDKDANDNISNNKNDNNINAPVQLQPPVKKKNSDDDNKNGNDNIDTKNNDKNDNDNKNNNNDNINKNINSSNDKDDNINNTNNDKGDNDNLTNNKNDNDNDDDKIDNINKDDDDNKNGNDNTNITKNVNNLNNDVDDVDDDKKDDDNKNNDNSNLFYPTYCYAKVKAVNFNETDPDPNNDNSNLANDEYEYYMTVGLNSNLKKSEFKRKHQNLVVVLDISGSMGFPFDYVYGSSNSNKEKTKMEIANEAVVTLIKKLKPTDRFGLVIFDTKAETIQKLELISDINLNQLYFKILTLKDNGGTDFEVGYNAALKLYSELNKDAFNDREYFNRIIILTDAQPNVGRTDPQSLLSLVGSYGNSQKNKLRNYIYTTFIGIGLDFNSNLIEIISSIRGSNYYVVKSSSDFIIRMDEEFEYMVCPLVFNVSLKLNIEGNSCKIDKVYGAKEKKAKSILDSGEIMSINTLFPSKKSKKKGGTKGGIQLIKLKKCDNNNNKNNNNDNDVINVEIVVTFEDVDGNKYENKQFVTFDPPQLYPMNDMIDDDDDNNDYDDNEKENFYDNLGIRKGILLCKYVELMRNWIQSTNKEKYKTILFPKFLKYFKKEMKKCKDDQLQKEVKIIEQIINDN